MEYILENFLCPGDVLAMSAAVHALKIAEPEAKIAVRTSCDAIYENNPDVVPAASLLNPQAIKMEYPLINACDRLPVHFLQGYVDFLAKTLAKPLTLQTNRPLLYLSREEQSWLNQVKQETGYGGKFWLISASWKNDFTIKRLDPDTLQDVVDATRGRVQWVQVGAAEHPHVKLRGVIDFVGKTDLRQLLRLAWHAQGGLGPESFLNHVFAAFQKPFVCVCSGFLPPHWVSYPSAKILHKANCFPCGVNGGKYACWRARATRLNDGDEKDRNLCELPVFADDGNAVARCIASISAEEITRAVEEFIYLGV